MTGLTARVAVQLEPTQLEDMQRSARTLLANPIITDKWPKPGALVEVRRWETILRAEFDRVLGYRLDVGRTCARLYRRPATLANNRGALTDTGRELGRLGYSSLCLILAAVEGLGEQTTASQIAEEVLRLRAGDEALPVDLTHYDQRRAFVDALKWLEARGVLGLRDGEVERWLSGDSEGDALYDLDHDVVSRLLITSPSVLRDVDTAADFLTEVIGSSDEALTRAMRHRIGRRIVTEPVVSFGDLDPGELAHFRHRRARIVGDLERLTGARIEVRSEGMLLVDGGDMSKEAFPGTGTQTQAALLWSAALLESALPPQRDQDPEPQASLATPWREVPVSAADEHWQKVVDGYRTKFKAEYREDPDRLRHAVEQMLERFGLLKVEEDGLLVHGALARYRPSPTNQDQAFSEPDLWSGASS